MKMLSRLLILLAVCAVGHAEEGVFPLWEELKSLYQQRIEKEFLERTEVVPKVPQVYAVSAAHYDLVISEAGVRGEVVFSGSVLSGDPEPIPIFGKETAVADVTELAGGVLLYEPDSDSLAFLPGAGVKEFQIATTFFPSRQEENGIQTVCFAIPRAVQNSLHLTLPEGARLVDPPGVVDVDGAYHFAPCAQLSVKYMDKAVLSAVIEFDVVTRIRIEKNRLTLSSCFQPLRPAPDSVVLHAPPGTRYITSSLNMSRLNKTGEDQYTITFPKNEQTPFSIDFTLDSRADSGEISLALPFIDDNTGAEDRFAVEEPHDGQVNVTAEGLSSPISVEKLGEVLAAAIPKNLFFIKAPPRTPLRLTYTPFQTASTPATVLASQSFFISFAENGTALSLLRLEAPPEMGARMRIKAIEDMEVWSLTVNGVKQSVYTDEEQRWVIPLDGVQPSLVELALLRYGPKLALQGALEVTVPETGLPSLEFCLGVALPPRIDLLSLEGPVSPATGAQWQVPAEFLGKPHFFSRSFHKGEGMTLSIAYKEPVNKQTQPQGEEQ